MKLENTQEILNKVFAILEDYGFFTYDELLLVIKAFGDNLDTYNTICYVRYGMDVEQLLENGGM